MIIEVPVLDGIIIHTENITSLRVFNVEILRQSPTRNFGSRKTLFGWHIDNEERKTNAKLTVIILLLITVSLIQTMTKSELVYERQGTALSFPSCLYHKSFQLEENTMELCLFLEDTDSIIASESSCQTT